MRRTVISGERVCCPPIGFRTSLCQNPIRFGQLLRAKFPQTCPNLVIRTFEHAFPQSLFTGGPVKAMDVPLSSSSSETQKRLISSYILVAEYGLLFLTAVAILLIVCLRSTSRLRTRLVYFYVITIIISLGTSFTQRLPLRETCLTGSLLPHARTVFESLFLTLSPRFVALPAFSVRVVAWSLEPWWNFRTTTWNLFLHSVLFALPPMLLVSTYTILVRPFLPSFHAVYSYLTQSHSLYCRFRIGRTNT